MQRIRWPPDRAGVSIGDVTHPIPSAHDINDIAWDSTRDSENDRRGMLRHLDSVPPCAVSDLLNPDARTSDGLPLGERARLLLLGCTAEDLEAITNEINAGANIDDASKHAELHDAQRELGALLGQHRLLKSDSDDRTVARMPLADRRRARELEIRVASMQVRRYDSEVWRTRALVATIARAQQAMAKATASGDVAEAARLENMITECRELLGSCP
jgi:hypothetical protein